MIVAAIRAIPNAKRKVKTNKTGIHRNSIRIPLLAIKWRGIYAIKDLINRLRADIEDAAGITTLGMAEFASTPPPPFRTVFTDVTMIWLIKRVQTYRLKTMKASLLVLSKPPPVKIPTKTK